MSPRCALFELNYNLIWTYWSFFDYHHFTRSYSVIKIPFQMFLELSNKYIWYLFLKGAPLPLVFHFFLFTSIHYIKWYFWLVVCVGVNGTPTCTSRLRIQKSVLILYRWMHTAGFLIGHIQNKNYFNSSGCLLL